MNHRIGRRSHRAVVTVACVTAFIVACAGSEHTAPPLPTSAAITTSDFQRELMADGVTFDEYERAFFAYADCVTAAGFEFVTPPRLTSRKNYDYQLMRRNVGGAADQAAEEERLRCGAEYWNEIQGVWSISTVMSQAERQEARDYLGACMRAEGVPDIPEHPTSQDWVQYIRVIPGNDPEPYRAFSRCQKLASEKYGLLPSEVP